MTRTEHRRHLRHARTLGRHPRPCTPTEHVWLLVPEGVPHDDELESLAVALGCNGIVSPHQGRSQLHREAEAAGLDTSKPVLFRPLDHAPAAFAVPPPLGEQFAFVAGWLASAVTGAVRSGG